MSQVNLIEALREGGFTGSHDDAQRLLWYIGLRVNMDVLDLHSYLRRNARLARPDLDSGDVTPELEETAIALMLLGKMVREIPKELRPVISRAKALNSIEVIASLVDSMTWDEIYDS